MRSPFILWPCPNCASLLCFPRQVLHIMFRLFVAKLFLAFACIASAVKLRPPQPGLDGRWLRWKAGLSCPFADRPYEAVRAALRGRIVAQDDALDTLFSAVRRWQDDLDRGVTSPLIFTLVGPTGVGKTATANALTRALLTGTHDERPDGLIQLLGSDYAVSGDPTSAGENGPGMLRIQNEVRSRLAQGLFECGGTAVVVFEEAQNAVRKALTTLRPLMQTPPILNVIENPGTPSARLVELAPKRLVIIVISDVGQSDIEGYMVRAEEAARELGSVAATAGGGSHASGGHAADGIMSDSTGRIMERALSRELAMQLRANLSAHWEASGLDLGAISSAVIPFQPMNQARAEAVVERELRLKIDAPPTGIGRLVVNVWDTVSALTDPALLNSFTPLQLRAPKPSRNSAGASKMAIGADGGTTFAPGESAGPHGVEDLCMPEAEARALGRFDRCRCTLPATVISSEGARSVIEQTDSAPFAFLLSRLIGAVEAWEAHGSRAALSQSMREIQGAALEREYRDFISQGHSEELLHDDDPPPLQYTFTSHRENSWERAAAKALPMAFGFARPPPPKSEIVTRVETQCGPGARPLLLISRCNVSAVEEGDVEAAAFAAKIAMAQGLPSPARVREACALLYRGPV